MNRVRRKYDEDFKTMVRNMYINGEFTTHIAKKYGLPPATIIEWCSGLKGGKFKEELKNDFVTVGNITKVFINYKDRIIETTIDTESLVKLHELGFRWHAKNFIKNDKDAFYCYTNKFEDGKRKAIALHNYIMDPLKRETVDHINGDTLDNRKSNLRVVTRSENMQNRKISINNTSGFPGVTFNKRRNKWFVQLVSKGKRYSGGYFTDIEDAKKASALLRQQHLSHYRKVGGDQYYD